MNPSQIIDQAKAKFAQAVTHFREELKKVRTGRAHPSMLDGVVVEAYGVQMPLVQVGTVTAPESQQLQITPFDPSNLAQISAAIRDHSSLDLNPSDDGRVVRIQIPPLTEERRREYVKLVSTKAEDCMISLRNARHEALKEAENAKKDRTITEDDLVSVKKRLDEELTKAKADVDTAVKAKETEVLTI